MRKAMMIIAAAIVVGCGKGSTPPDLPEGEEGLALSDTFPSQEGSISSPS